MTSRDLPISTMDRATTLLIRQCSTLGENFFAILSSSRNTGTPPACWDTDCTDEDCRHLWHISTASWWVIDQLNAAEGGTKRRRREQGPVQPPAAAWWCLISAWIWGMSWSCTICSSIWLRPSVGERSQPGDTRFQVLPVLCQSR